MSDQRWPITGRLSSPVWGIDLLVIGRELFTTATPGLDASVPLRVTFAASLSLQFALAGWFLFVLVICLGEVQRFGIWKAITSLVLAGVLMFGLFVPVVWLVQWVWRPLVGLCHAPRGFLDEPAVFSPSPMSC